MGFHWTLSIPIKGFLLTRNYISKLLLHLSSHLLHTPLKVLLSSTNLDNSVLYCYTHFIVIHNLYTSLIWQSTISSCSSLFCLWSFFTPISLFLYGPILPGTHGLFLSEIGYSLRTLRPLKFLHFNSLVTRSILSKSESVVFKNSIY